MFRAPRNKADLLKLVTKPVASSKCSARSTLVINYTDGSRAIRYHDTDVATFKKNKVILNSGGFRTATTKERINEHTNLRVFTEGGIWYVCPVGQWDKKEYFYDGITFSTEGKLLTKSKNVPMDKVKKIKKKIAAFVKLVDKLESIPMPESGDCWGCSMFNTDDCLEQHMEEKYLHGSLIYRALEARGYSNPAVIMQMGCKDSIKRALRRMLMKKLLPEVQA